MLFKQKILRVLIHTKLPSSPVQDMDLHTLMLQRHGSLEVNTLINLLDSSVQLIRLLEQSSSLPQSFLHLQLMVHLINLSKISKDYSQDIMKLRMVKCSNQNYLNITTKPASLKQMLKVELMESLLILQKPTLAQIL